MAQTELVSAQLQIAVEDELDSNRSLSSQLRPFLDGVGGLPILLTMFYDLAIAIREFDEDRIDEQYYLLSSNPKLSAMFEQNNWAKGKLSAVFIEKIIHALQHLESKVVKADDVVET